MILAILLGPYAAFLVMASVLTVQALFFADGGLLALGCNIFNLGFFPAFIAYPFIYKKIVGQSHSRGRIFAGSIVGGDRRASSWEPSAWCSRRPRPASATSPSARSCG